MTNRPRLVLASRSPARLATLRAAGVEPDVIVSDVPEDGVDDGSASGTALLLARLKAEAVAPQVVGSAFVLGCDSVLEIDGETYGKPASSQDAVARWRLMRGRTGILHTGHWLIATDSGRTAHGVASTLVRFAEVTDQEIDAYVATGEPLHVAGAFTIDGLGGAFVDGVDGDPHNVVGLSLPLLRRLLRELGVAWPSLWTEPVPNAPS